MRLHVETLFTRNAAGRLLEINEPRGGAAPRVFCGRTAHGHACWFRYDVPADLASELERLSASLPSGLDIEIDAAGAAPFLQLLSRYGPVEKMWAGPVFHFPADLPDHESVVRVTGDNVQVLTPWLEEWQADVASGVPMLASIVDDRAVSVCCSVRITDAAHEAGVETHSEFRGQGHARAATAAWASEVRRMGAVPLYSTSWKNTRSRALARSLRLVQFGSDFHIT